MSSFNFLKKKTYDHPVLGSFQRSSAYWRGKLSLDSDESVDLLLSGDKKSPDNNALQLATELTNRYRTLKPAIEQALYEHYIPYRQAVDGGNFPDAPDPFPVIDNESLVWPYVRLCQISIEPMVNESAKNKMTVEIAYTIGWDEEHTVGVRFVEWHLEELCGSI